MPRQGVMQVLDEVVLIVIVQRHECAPHNDELHFSDRVPKLTQLDQQHTTDSPLNHHRGME